MVKKFLSLVMAVSIVLSAVFTANVFALESSFAELDLSSKEIGSYVNRHGGNGNEALVVEEDGKKSVLIGPAGAAYTINEKNKTLLQYFMVSNSNGLSADTKGMVFESTLKITNKSANIILVTNTSNVNPRIISLNSGVVKYNHDLSSSATATTVAYPENTWFTIKLRTNFTTGYSDIEVKNLSTNAVSKASFVAESWKKTTAEQLASFKSFAWYFDGSAGYTYTSAFSVKTETDAEAIAPSKIIAEDDFDNAGDKITGWSSDNYDSVVTDRGKSVLFPCDAANKVFYHSANIPAAAKGLVTEFSIKLSATGGTEFIYAAGGNTSCWPSGNARLIQFTSGGTINAFNGGAALGTYTADKWYDVKIENNFAKDFIRYTISDGSSENVYEVTKELSNFDDLTAVKYFVFASSSAATSKNVYLDDINIRWVDEKGLADIVPSNKVVRDNFDDNTDSLKGWSGSGAVATTDRGKSALINCAVAETQIYKTVSLPVEAKGLVSEFSVKLSSADGTQFIFAATDAGDWYSANKKLIQFTANGQINAFNGAINVGTYAADTWYDVRIENNFVNDFTRIIIYDGKNETVTEGVYETTVYDTPSSAIKYLQFISSTAVEKSIYIDDVNIFWLTDAEVSGLKNPRSYSIHNEFENFEECENGDDLIADATCDAYKSFKATPGEKFRIGIESVIASGRGKSFKATTVDKSEHRFYKDFSAVQNGVVEFDIMLEEKSGVVMIETQLSGSQNENMVNTWLFRFAPNGNIMDRNNKNIIGTYLPGAWHHVVMKSGTFEIDGVNRGGVKFEIYNSQGLICEDTISMSTDEVTRDSIRLISVTMVEGANTVYVDNVRAYTDTQQGIYPEMNYIKRTKTATTEDKLSLAFSKAIDLEKSEFKVNGEKVNVSGSNIVYIEKEIKAGQKYDIEYKAIDTDGYATLGFIGDIKALAPIEIVSFTKATMEVPTATLTFLSNAQAPTRAFWLVVVAMNGDKMVDISIDTQEVGTGEQTLTATAVVDENVTEVKTFLWDKKTLSPFELE